MAKRPHWGSDSSSARAAESASFERWREEDLFLDEAHAHICIITAPQSVARSHHCEIPIPWLLFSCFKLYRPINFESLNELWHYLHTDGSHISLDLSYGDDKPHLEEIKLHVSENSLLTLRRRVFGSEHSDTHSTMTVTVEIATIRPLLCHLGVAVVSWDSVHPEIIGTSSVRMNSSQILGFNKP